MLFRSDWSASGTLAWTPARANPSYRLGVWVRSAGNTADEFESTGTQYFEIVERPGTVAAEATVEWVDLVADREEPQPAGSTVAFTARPTGGRAPYSYKWWLWDGASWALLEEWSTHATLRWRPAVANRSYRIGVWVRSAGRDTDAFESTGTRYFEIGPPSHDAPPTSAGTADCVRLPSPALLTFGSGGGTQTLSVDTVNSTCAWSSASLASWMTTTGQLRTGAAALAVSVSANDGFAARNGVYVADLASCGIQATPNALHGKAGFYRAFGKKNVDYGRRLLEKLGVDFEFTAVTYKQYPACQVLRGIDRKSTRLNSSHT